MHSFIGKYGTNIFHNGDYSGEAHILNTDTNTEVKVEMEDLLDFVAEYVRSNAIEKLEQMDTTDLLKFLK